MTTETSYGGSILSDKNHDGMNPSENKGRPENGKAPRNKGGYDSIYYTESSGKDPSAEHKRPKRRPRPRRAALPMGAGANRQTARPVRKAPVKNRHRKEPGEAPQPPGQPGERKAS